MFRRANYKHRGLTLVEITLVLGLLAVVTAMVVPNFFGTYQRTLLPTSARQLSSLITLVRANAQFDGLRYRIRFPQEYDAPEDLQDQRQPIIEREDDPIEQPGIFNPVSASWTFGKTLLGDVWCIQVRLGRPRIIDLMDERDRGRDEEEDELEIAFEDFDPRLPPLIIEPDGSSDWAVLVITDAEPETLLEDLFDEDEVQNRIELIVDGDTTLAWLQRPFYEEELDMFFQHNWPAVLRQDFLDPRVLTEDDVLEIRDSGTRR